MNYAVSSGLRKDSFKSPSACIGNAPVGGIREAGAIFFVAAKCFAG